MSPRSQEDDEEVIGAEEEGDENECRQQRKKPKLMDESGLTEAERRRIRQSQRALQQTLRETVEDVGFAELEQVRQRNNQVFQSSVLYTREGTSCDDACFECCIGMCCMSLERSCLTFNAVSLPLLLAAVLDADTVDLIAAKYAQQIEKQILVRPVSQSLD
jgi:hypothetical protein